MSKTTILIPVVSEKAYGASSSLNRFAFVVPKTANKHEVARAVAAQYGVEVVSVAIVNQLGKTTRAYRSKRMVSGSRSDYKKAYVTIKAGQSLPIFAAVEEAEAPKPAKEAKSSDKPKKSLLKRASKKEEK
ncbi:50S ribosomal protein L23 [Candidatus Saccharibacteria bacterium]|jgi:large subunit ribosomal protein L23|nr:MAG: 50S ribosomal protein L23 [Candidatus Saccharibacteria bacterium]